MTYKHIGFSDSIVMKELEKVAYKRNLVQLDPEPEVKQIKLASSDDLFLDIITLAAALREKGFTKQAQGLEEKALQFKVAAEHDQYSWWKETGEQLLNDSHLPDDFKDIPSTKGDGHVEDNLEVQKAVMKTLTHQPTGKVGSRNDEIVSMAITALGQEVDLSPADVNTLFSEKQKRKANAEDVFLKSVEDIPKIKSIIDKTKNENLKNLLNQALYASKNLEIVQKNDDIYHNQIRGKKDKPAPYLMKIDSNSDNYKAVIDNINAKITSYNEDKDNKIARDTISDQVYNDFMNASQSEKKTNENTVKNNINLANNDINSIAIEINKRLNSDNTKGGEFYFFNDNTFWEIQQNLQNVPKYNQRLKNDVLPSPISQLLMKEKSPIEYKPDWSNVRRTALASLEAIQVKEEEKTQKRHPEVQKDIEALNDDKNFSDPKTGIQFINKINNNIDEYIKNYSNAYKGEAPPESIKRVASQYESFLKEAYLPAGKTSTQTPASAGPSVPGAAKTQPSQISSKEDPEIAFAVSMMQKFIVEFGEFASASLSTKEVFPEMRSAINTAKTSTRGLNKDGVWGPNTTKALSAIKNYIKQKGMQGEIIETKPASKEDIITAADNNRKVIMQALASLDSKYQHLTKEVYGDYLDVLPKSLGSLEIIDPSSGIILKASDLKSLYSLKSYLQSNDFAL